MSASSSATFEALDAARSSVAGILDFSTVARLLAQGAAAIEAGRAAVIDLQGVTASDSSGLALVIEWLSVAKRLDRPLRYDHLPTQLQQLARLAEVEELLAPT